MEDQGEGPLRVRVECVRTIQGYPRRGVFANVRDRPEYELVDLPANAPTTRLVWHKRRFMCPKVTCLVGSWMEEGPRIASSRLQMTDRSGRWITEQVGYCARSVWRGDRKTRL